MPRGNLEGIAPRALVLAAIADSLTRGAFARAWDLASNHRVDLNLLVDWGWPFFLHNATSFVEAVPAASDLNDLLFAMKNENVCAEGGLYANIPVHAPKPGPLTADADGPQGVAGNAGVDSDEEAADAFQMKMQLWDDGDGGGGGGDKATMDMDDPKSSGKDEPKQTIEEVPTRPGVLTSQRIEALIEAGNKVNAVCVAIREAVHARMASQKQQQQQDARDVVGVDGVARALPTSAAAAAAAELLSVVVTSHARCDPPELPAALVAIRDAKEADLVSH